MLAWEKGQKVAVFFSDISGAFDRVRTERLLEKCRRAGVGETLLAFLQSYLRPRSAQVVVNGAHSEPLTLENEVFQGTVLGPPLWNTFFSDVDEAACSAGATAFKFADDLNCYKLFPATTPTESLLTDLRNTQEACHSWGRANQVLFDANKEDFAVLHRSEGHGEDFRVLGTWFDTGLKMQTAVKKLTAVCAPKLKALLRSRSYFTTAELVLQFKSHVLGVVECRTPGLYHAASTVLKPLDALYYHFVRELGLSAEEAFLQYNLAPFSLRRDVAMLGLLHKCTLGLAHPQLCKLFPLAEPLPRRYQTRAALRAHERQLPDRTQGRHSELLRRSAFGLARVYNRLPAGVVANNCVKGFQHDLTALARERCTAGDLCWLDCFSPRPHVDAERLET